jgi:hypothetical protein
MRDQMSDADKIDRYGDRLSRRIFRCRIDFLGSEAFRSDYRPRHRMLVAGDHARERSELFAGRGIGMG